MQATPDELAQVLLICTRLGHEPAQLLDALERGAPNALTPLLCSPDACVKLTVCIATFGTRHARLFSAAMMALSYVPGEAFDFSEAVCLQIAQAYHTMRAYGCACSLAPCAGEQCLEASVFCWISSRAHLICEGNVTQRCVLQADRAEGARLCAGALAVALRASGGKGGPAAAAAQDGTARRAARAAPQPRAVNGERTHAAGAARAHGPAPDGRAQRLWPLRRDRAARPARRVQQYA